MTITEQLQDLQDLVKFYAKNENYKIIQWPDDKLDEEEFGLLSEKEDV
jgi:glutathione peroxidase-family protein